MSASFDIAAIRREFPITQRSLYFNSAHQAPLSVCVKAALEKFYGEGLEAAGPKSRWLARVEDVRARLAGLIGADPSEIAFTKNTSEGLNIAANALALTAGDNVLLVEGDHPNNAYAFLNLRAKGVDVRFVPMGRAAVDADSFVPYIDARTRAISLSHVTFHAGHVSDIAGIGRLCAEKSIHLIVDAMQSVGVMPLDVAALPPSMLAFGCHKGLLVPQGLGVLYASKALPEMRPAYLALAGLAHPPADLVARADNMQLKAGAQRFEIGNYNLPDIHALGRSARPDRTGGPGQHNPARPRPRRPPALPSRRDGHRGGRAARPLASIPYPGARPARRGLAPVPGDRERPRVARARRHPRIIRDVQHD